MDRALEVILRVAEKWFCKLGFFLFGDPEKEVQNHFYATLKIFSKGANLKAVWFIAMVDFVSKYPRGHVLCNNVHFRDSLVSSITF